MKCIKNVYGDSDLLRAQIWFDAEWDEYRVIFRDQKGHSIPKADYHTDDKDDAVTTAQSEVARMNARERLALVQAMNP